MVEISVCIGSACHVKGSYNIVQTFQQMIEEYSLHAKVNFKASFCMKQCQFKGVSVSVNGTLYDVPPETARDFFRATVMPAIG